MILNLKIYYFGLVLLLITDGLLGLRFEQLVKFSCEICSPDPDECCVGTVVHKDVILTTSYCATSCQFIHKYDRNIDIVKTHKQPRMEAKTRHDIALVIVNIDWKLNGVANLSFVDVMSAIGLKAYFPFMDDGNTRMREIILQTCGKPGQKVYGNHVCGAKETPTVMKKCYQRQGVPLLLDGKVIAISAATNNRLCSDDQIVFHTVAPELSWIEFTISELYPFGVNELVTALSTPTTIMRTPTLTSVSDPTPTHTTTQTSSLTTTVPTETLITILTEAPTAVLRQEITEASTEIPRDATASASAPAASMFSTQTDAMEWFNQKVRNKLKSGNHSYFVLTTTKRVYATPFIDLTV